MLACLLLLTPFAFRPLPCIIPYSGLTSSGDPDALEAAAAEMAAAAASLVSIERAMLSLSTDSGDRAALAAKQVWRGGGDDACQGAAAGGAPGAPVLEPLPVPCRLLHICTCGPRPSP